MLTLPEAITRFDAASAASIIPNRKTGALGSLKPSRREPILSHVRKALQFALEQLNGNRAVPTEALETTDLTPLLHNLPTNARLAAQEEEKDPDAVSKIESNVRLFVSVVLGSDVTKHRQPITRQRVLPAFQQLYDCLDAYVEENGGQHRNKRRPLRRGFVLWVQLASANGIGAPDDVPDDYATVMAWGERLGWSRKETTHALNAWRKAVTLASAPYAMARDLIVHDGIGIRSLPEYPALADARGYAGNIADATSAELLHTFAPKLSTALEAVIEKGTKEGRSNAWANDTRDAASWVVAGLIQLNLDPAVYTWFDLWTVRQPVEVRIDTELDDQLAQYGIESGVTTAQHSLMRLILDRTAARSYELSPLRLFNQEYEKDAIPVYTESLCHNVEMAWVVTEMFFRQRMHAAKPELWAQARIEYDEIRHRTVSYNRPRMLVGRKAKDSLPITWPQLVCMGLPWLSRHCYELRREVSERLARIGNLESRNSHILLNRYCTALTDYAIVALLTDDCLRVKNYAGAMAGTHIRVSPYTDADGRWTGFSEIRTSFRMIDDDAVSLKSKKVSGGIPNQRLNRRVSPGIVDHTLFFEYWTIARPRALVAASLLQSVESFDPTNDCFAAFVTPRPSAAQKAAYHASMNGQSGDSQDDIDPAPLPAWRGNISPDMLSVRFGVILHRICTEVLGRQLPPWKSKELTTEYPKVFAGHTIRLLVATYLGGVRNNWQEATYRTNDAEVTLRNHYVHLSAWAKEREHLDSPEGLHWFDKVMDRVMKMRGSDDARWSQFWRLFDPLHPHIALAWLDRQAMLVPGSVPAKRRSRRSAETGALPGARKV